MKPKVMLIEACDFSSFPVGGHLSHTRQLVQIFGERLALVGISIDDTPVGVWTKKNVAGFTLDFFSLGRVTNLTQKPLIPRRLTAFLRLKYFKRQILSLGINAAYVVAPEVMIAVSNWGLRVAYKFSGIENPLTMARYPFATLLAAPFEKRLFSSLAKHAEIVFAAADKKAIEALVRRSNATLDSSQIVPLPTSVDSETFHVSPIALPGPDCSKPVFISCGRLNRVKGWDLILDAFQKVQKDLPSAQLYFVGDGEDRSLLEKQVADTGLNDSVVVTGFVIPTEVAGLLNRSHVFLLGSHREGWPTAMVEALTCGLPVVATNVSGVNDLVEEKRNGYVVKTRDADEFAAKMVAALDLPRPNLVSLEIAKQYALTNIKKELELRWAPFCGD